MNAIQGSNSEGGPMWSRFWDSFSPSAADLAENGSQLSENSNNNSNNYLAPPPFISPQPSTSLKTYSDVLPSESASMVNNNNEASSSSLTTAVPIAQDVFTFKFTLAEQKTHRVVTKLTYNELLEAIRSKLSPNQVENEKEWLTLSYLDDEGDKVLITCNSDVLDAVHLAMKAGQNKVKLFVQDDRIDTSKSTTSSSTAATEKITTFEEKIETVKEEKTVDETSKGSSSHIILSATIVLVAATAAGVYIYSKTSKQR